MNLRRRFRFLLGIQVAMAISLAILTAALFRNEEALSRASRFTSSRICWRTNCARVRMT